MKVRSRIIPCLVITLIVVVTLALSAENLLPPTFSLSLARPSQSLDGSFTISTLRYSSVFNPSSIFLPFVSRAPESGPWIDPSDRQVSLDYFNQVYLASEGIAIGWTGNHAGCQAGETSAAFLEAVRLRINYFRAMAGVPATVQLSPEFTRKAQQAALMMSVNHQLNHNPPPGWLCYSNEGAQAAGKSNLYLGINGPAAITGYINDPGSNNYAAGHRRWILYPQTQWMGTGDIPAAGGYWSSNALWVFDENMWGPRPETRNAYVAWPPPGYVPYIVVFKRWSFALDDADFSQAAVQMSSAGQGIPLAIQPVVIGYGENTLVWEPNLSIGVPPAGDTIYDVTLSGVLIGSAPHDFTYQVILFDPGLTAGIQAGVHAGQLDEPPVLPGIP